METWTSALKVFIYGFSGVFIGLILLMFAIKLKAFVLKNLSKKETK
jgi:hypothetical protein